jgi:hypothetical protein
MWPRGKVEDPKHGEGIMEVTIPFWKLILSRQEWKQEEAKKPGPRGLSAGQS